MLNIQYNILCSIVFEHSFFSDGVCREISVKPTSETVQLMDSYGLLLKNASGRVVILQKIEGNSTETPFIELTRLRFLVYLENPALYNLCDLGGVRQFYLSNVDAAGVFKNTLTQKGELSNLDSFQTSIVVKNKDIEKEKYNEIAQSLPFFALIELFLDSTISAGTTYKTVIPNRKFRFQYVFIDIPSKQIDFNTTITVSGKRHVLDTINTTTFTLSNLTLASDNPTTKLEQLVAQLKKVQNNKFYAVESTVDLVILENRPPTIGFGQNTKFVKLPVPTIDNLQIIENKAVIFFTI